jgi:phage tail sheath gpL-like
VIQIVGFSSSFKVPMFAAETIFGAGALAQGSIPINLLLVGLISDDGTMTENGSPVQAFDQDEANAYAGEGSQLARMFAAASRVPNVRIWLAAPARAGGAVGASATITFAGPASSSGEVFFRVGGETVSVTISSGDTATDIGDATVTAFSEKPWLPVTAVNDAGEVTLEVKSAGVEGNQYVLHKDETLLAAGVTVTLAGGASVTGGGVKFTGGTGTTDVTTLLTAIYSGWYQRIAIAQNDATNLGRWRTHINAKAGPTEGRMEHVVVATNGTQSAAASLSTATLNDPRFQNLWQLNGESHPSETAAAMAALRAATEGDDPGASYDDKQLLGIAPQAFVADWPSVSTQSACLDNGVTPLLTTNDGRVVVCRSITTRCLNGTTPDYNTLDTSEAVVPDYVRDGLRLVWLSEFKPANPRVADDLPDGKERPAGVATPKRWTQRTVKYLKDLESASPPQIIDVDTHLPTSEYNSAAKRIMSICPVVVAPSQHQIGVSVRQMAA